MATQPTQPQPDYKAIFDRFAEKQAADLLKLRDTIEQANHPDSAEVLEQVSALMSQCLELKESLAAAK